MKLQNQPVGIQNFEKLRKEGYLYVDKTALISSQTRNVEKWVIGELEEH